MQRISEVDRPGMAGRACYKPDYGTSPEFSERERAALAFTAVVVPERRQVQDSEWARLRMHFSEPEIVELVFAVGYQSFATTFAKAFQLEPQGFSR